MAYHWLMPAGISECALLSKCVGSVLLNTAVVHASLLGEVLTPSKMLPVSYALDKRQIYLWACGAM